MDMKMLVEVWASDGGNNGWIATGYPVAKNRIITARHTLYPNGSQQPCINIEVRWHYLLKEDPKYDWQDAEIIPCDLDEELDIVLLKCDFPDEIQYTNILAQQNPEKRFKWDSKGFAKIAERNEYHEPLPLKGESFIEVESSFRITLENDASRVNPILLQGISGCPVFSDNTFFGVVTSCPEEFKGERLFASPMWKLLQYPKFREEILYEECQKKEARIRKVRKKIEKLLPASSKAYKTLSENLADIFDSAALSKALINKEIVEFLELCDEAITELCDSQEPEAARAVQEIVYLLTPVVCDQSIIEVIKGDAQFGVIQNRIATTTFAEIILAAKENRALDFVPHDNPRDELLGRNNLRSQVNCGIDGANLKAEQTTDHLIEKYAGVDELAKIQKIGRENLIKDASDELAKISKYYSQTLYFVYVLPDDDSLILACKREVETLKNRFPAVIFMEISRNAESRNDERNTYFLLRKIHTTKIED